MNQVLSPIKVGAVQFKNRIMYLAMAKFLSCDDFFITDRQIAYYANYAANGVGVLVSGACIVDGEYPSRFNRQPGLFDDKFIPRLKALTEAVHKADGKILFQLWHPGSISYGCETSQAKACEHLSIEEIKSLQKKYIDAARRAEEAGADGIEFHLAHNYLPAQFLTPALNKRTDNYSAKTIESGLRFSTEIIAEIRKNCENNFLIGVKINGEDFMPGGMTPERAAQAAVILEGCGVDLITVSAGGAISGITAMSADGHRPEGWKVYLAEAVKKAVSIPVVATDSIRRPEYIEQLLEQGKCDIIGMGRGLLAEPEWVKKLAEGRSDEMRMCMSCMSCFDANAGGAGCAMNPMALRESENIELRNDGGGRVVAIVGAGPAGLQAAVTLAQRGFKPVVLEADSVIGGKERLAAMPEGKSKIFWHLDYFKRQISNLNIEVRLSCRATPELLDSIKPYAVFIATGSRPTDIKSIPGIDMEHVVQNREALEELAYINESDIVIAGAGQVGLELGYTLAGRNSKVTIIDMIEEHPAEITLDHKLSIETALNRGVEIKLGHKLLEITENAVIAEVMATGERLEIPAKKLIFCLGSVPEKRLYEQIKDKFLIVRNIGDSYECRRIINAVQMGFDEAVNLD